MRLRLSLAAFAGLLISGLIAAADPITGPTTLKPYTIGVYKISTDPGTQVTAFEVPAGLDLRDRADEWYVTGKPGTYTIRAAVLKVDFEKKTHQFKIISVPLTIQGAPAPVPPKPPTPTPPGPTPPTPTPDPVDPAPIPVVGFRVLVVYDGPTLTKLPASQQAAIFAADVRAYLNDKCAVGADGKTREWRMWPADTDVSQAEDVWQFAMKRQRASLPWIIVSNGKTGFEGKLPGSKDELLALLKKYGG